MPSAPPHRREPEGQGGRRSRCLAPRRTAENPKGQGVDSQGANPRRTVDIPDDKACQARAPTHAPGRRNLGNVLAIIDCRCPLRPLRHLPGHFLVL